MIPSERRLREWQEILHHHLATRGLNATMTHQEEDPNLIGLLHASQQRLRKDLEALKAGIQSFLVTREWSDVREFLDARIGILEGLLDSSPRARSYSSLSPMA